MPKDPDEKLWKAELPEDDGVEEERLRRKWEREQELKNAQREKRLREQKRKLHAIMILAGIFAFMIVTLAILTVKVFIPLWKYQSANRNIEKGEYAAAINSYREMLSDYGEDYKDIAQRLSEAYLLQAKKLSGKENVYYETSESAPWFTVTEDGTLNFSKDDYTGDWNIVIPDVFDGILVDTLAKKAFSHCENLVSITFSDCITEIKEYAFLYCTELSSAELPVHLKTIGASAFEGCTALKTVTFGEELTTIDAGAFAKCTALTEVTLPDSLKTLGSRAFNVCSALKLVGMGPIEKIGSYAFTACEEIETIFFRGTHDEWQELAYDLANMGLENVTVVTYNDR